MEISLKQYYLDKLHKLLKQIYNVFFVVAISFWFLFNIRFYLHDNAHSSLYPCWTASLTLAEWEIRKQQIGINIVTHSGREKVRALTKVKISPACFVRLVEPWYQRISHVTLSSLVEGNGAPFSNSNILYICFFFSFFRCHTLLQY